jgi:uncharacterized protein
MRRLWRSLALRLKVAVCCVVALAGLNCVVGACSGVCEAAERNNWPMLFLALALHAGNASGEQGGLALMAACDAGHVSMARVLIHFGAPVDGFDGHGGPLALAVDGHQVAAAQVLLERGADVSACDPIGRRTALHEAALNGDCEAAALLLDWGAPVNALDSHWDTPLDLAIDHDHEAAYRLLRRRGAMCGGEAPPERDARASSGRDTEHGRRTSVRRGLKPRGSRSS